MSTSFENFSITLGYAKNSEEYSGVIVVAMAIVVLITVVFFIVANAI